jgi:hypothetical protein
LHASAVGGYVDLDEDDTNGVALFGCGLLRGDDQHLWGLNTVLMDNATYATHTGTGRILASELDYNVCGTGTQVMGLSLGGASLAQPTQADAFLVNRLGVGIKWTSGFWSMDGCATYGLILGAAENSGANVDSQPLLWKYLDGAGDGQTVSAYVDEFSGVGFLKFSGSASWAFAVSGADIFLETGRGLRINGNMVVSDRIIDADLAKSPNTGDADTDALIAALKSLILTHGLGAAA